MLLKTSLLEFQVQATDGELGKVKDVYFDSKDWTVRYLVIDTKKWLPGKKVLVSPVLVGKIDVLESNIFLNATTEQVKNSPSIDEHEPISRKVEKELYSYYGWDTYWYGAGVWSGGKIPKGMTPTAEQYAEETQSDNKLYDEKIHLRSMNELTDHVGGYTLQAKDQVVGQLADFIIENESWTIKYFMIDTGDILPGYKRFINPGAIGDINIAEKEVFVELHSDDVTRISDEVITSKEMRGIDEDSTHEAWNRGRI